MVNGDNVETQDKTRCVTASASPQPVAAYPAQEHTPPTELLVQLLQHQPRQRCCSRRLQGAEAGTRRQKLAISPHPLL